jgi:hypothetical protein
MVSAAHDNLREFRTFTHKDASYRICCNRYETAVTDIIRQRDILERYIARYPEFQHSFSPVPAIDNTPQIALHMFSAAERTGVGPMAAVAGAMAQSAANACLREGATEVIIDNGGDIYLVATAPVTIAIFSGTAKLGAHLAFVIEPRDTPLSVCSSSGRMGHSQSLGDCDLATIVSKDAALADAAATLTANLVKTVRDIDAALEQVTAIPGIEGVLIIKDDRIGLAGRLPPLVKRSG